MNLQKPKKKISIIASQINEKITDFMNMDEAEKDVLRHEVLFEIQEIIGQPENPIILNNEDNDYSSLDPYLEELEEFQMLLEGESEWIKEQLG